MEPAIIKQIPDISNGGMVSIAIFVAPALVPHTNHSITKDKIINNECLFKILVVILYRITLQVIILFS